MGVEGVHPELADRLAHDRGQRDQAVAGVGAGQEAQLQAAARVADGVAAQLGALDAPVDPGVGEDVEQRLVIEVPAAVLVAADVGDDAVGRVVPERAEQPGERREMDLRLRPVPVEPRVEPRRADDHRADRDDPPGRPLERPERPRRARSARATTRRGSAGRRASSQGDSSASSSVPAPTAASRPPNVPGASPPATAASGGEAGGVEPVAARPRAVEGLRVVDPEPVGVAPGAGDGGGEVGPEVGGPVVGRLGDDGRHHQRARGSARTPPRRSPPIASARRSAPGRPSPSCRSRLDSTTAGHGIGSTAVRPGVRGS